MGEKTTKISSGLASDIAPLIDHHSLAIDHLRSRLSLGFSGSSALMVLGHGLVVSQVTSDGAALVVNYESRVVC